ncbi:hypothetical protein Gotur_016018 [Gossypium turneri]
MQNWNSPRSSFNSLHLDEIKEMNLNNMQEDIHMQTKSLATWKLSSKQ